MRFAGSNWTIATGLAVAGLVMAVTPRTASAQGDAAHGKSVFESQCTACHSLTANRVGPKLGGVVGRKAGTAAQFQYSPALKASSIVWSQPTLDQWLTSPQSLIPGQRMNITVSDAKRRADIIAYLMSAGAK